MSTSLSSPFPASKLVRAVATEEKFRSVAFDDLLCDCSATMETSKTNNGRRPLRRVRPDFVEPVPYPFSVSSRSAFTSVPHREKSITDMTMEELHVHLSKINLELKDPASKKSVVDILYTV
jgi:hypothetical protein